MLPHEKLETFWLAEEYVGFIDYMLPRIRKTSKADADQIDREAGSIILNLIEAAAETSPPDKVRFAFLHTTSAQMELGGVTVNVCL